MIPLVPLSITSDLIRLLELSATSKTPLSRAMSVGPKSGELLPPAVVPLLFEDPATLFNPKTIPTDVG